MPRIRKLISLPVVMAIIIAVPAIYIAFCWFIDRLLALPPLSESPQDAYLFVAAFSLAIGLFWVFWAYSCLHFVGLGSPVEIFRFALLPTEQLVTTGPYAYTRNPMFLGLLFTLLAVAMYGRSITGLALLPVIGLVGLEYFRRYEEPALGNRFGEEYRQYQESVPALVPRFTR